MNYIHFNPVKHGYVTRASDWPYSSVHRYIARGMVVPIGASGFRKTNRRNSANVGEC